ncbi:CAMK/RAD53 protein kinase [Nannizzia gypsea CBS 118893]|uniref:CAMK/RAD53 protein kinase n=1 Tax=Arthroderma gypseum (strain ATCC MYA-4604 / CBS 118893) TaxID=535722 RepID=E4UWV0_ARTGP|nr:CAMK/RAD53 protein kinase [Nannizzia gypsea CBS 118893]EFR01803.1 CAMK/RAD53 protein kinase [Nannizzia gypsea CBS 118893]
MPPQRERSHLKRERGNAVPDQESKKPRRSPRISSQLQQDVGYLPSPLANEIVTEEKREVATVSPPEESRNQAPRGQSPDESSCPTQGFSQYPPIQSIDDVEDEAAQGIWGYLTPLDNNFGGQLVLKKRDSTNTTPVIGAASGISTPESTTSKRGTREISRAGYLIGRHAECDFRIKLPTISNRHCLIFHENRGGDFVAIVEDLSINGTFINDAIIGRNKRRELENGDEITILQESRFIFNYPRNRNTSKFRQQYKLFEMLGKGHFASVYLCAERSTGVKFAVKHFEKRPGAVQRLDREALQQEISMLMSVNHPNMLCLKDTFDENDGVYLVLELAPEGELFNWIIRHQKLTDEETRKVFIQLFEGLKYLHERNIIHRDIKPENILVVDTNLTVKLADFGLAKIVGEHSFTTTLCGTPGCKFTYVAPEILAENAEDRMYTRAVDIWSLGVVLYICLCGFPPFSDELYDPRHFPYNQKMQIQHGYFNFPSPYWDSVDYYAVDLIDNMLKVDVNKRLTVDQCLQHPWITGIDPEDPGIADSTDDLAGAIRGLKVSKERRATMVRRLLSDIHEVTVKQVVKTKEDDPASQKITIYQNHPVARAQEPKPAANRNSKEFMELGGSGDQVLFDDPSDNDSLELEGETRKPVIHQEDADETPRGRKR